MSICKIRHFSLCVVFKIIESYYCGRERRLGRVDQTKIGDFLKELRKEKNLTQEQLAEQLNVSNRSVSRWETGISLR